MLGAAGACTPAQRPRGPWPKDNPARYDPRVAASNGPTATAAGELTLGGDMTVRRLGYGAMRITGDGHLGRAGGPRRRDRGAAARGRAGRQLHRHRRLVRPGRERGADRGGAASLPRRPRDRDQGRADPAGAGQLAARLPPGAPEEVLRGQPAAAEARHDRPLPAAHAGSEGPVRGIGRRAVRAARRGQGAARRPLQRRAAATSTRRRRSSRSSRSRTATASPRATRRRC